MQPQDLRELRHLLGFIGQADKTHAETVAHIIADLDSGRNATAPHSATLVSADLARIFRVGKKC